MQVEPKSLSENATTDPGVESLLARIRGGDRGAAADFLEGNAPLIRRRYRHKLGRAMRRVFDSQDLMSTVARRLDHLIRSGHVLAANSAQFWALLFRIADGAVVDKIRVIQRLNKVEAPESEFAQALRARLEAGSIVDDESGDLVLARLFESIPEAKDREILSLWLSGSSHAVIAQLTELKPDVVRKRWERIRQHCRETLEEHAA